MPKSVDFKGFLRVVCRSYMDREYIGVQLQSVLHGP